MSVHKMSGIGGLTATMGFEVARVYYYLNPSVC
jgi:hypothetical protein